MKPAKGDLEIQEDISFQKRVWRVERIGWSIMALLILAALIGLAGPGPLSKEERWDGSAKVKAEFNRLDRYQAPATLKLSIDPTLTSAGELQVDFNREFVEQIEIKRIDPEPQRVEVRGGKFRFYFAASSNEQVSIIFHYEPNHFGKMPIHLSLNNDHHLNFEQYYFP